MAISNELSSEIAAAILANNNSPQDLLKLKEVLLEIHSTLQKMSEEEHPSRLRLASIRPAIPSDKLSH
jgi:predicted transcriptional regulator